MQGGTIISLDRLAKLCLLRLRTLLALYGCQGTLLTPVQFAINSDPQISLHGAALQPLISQFVCRTKTILSQVENPELAPVKFLVNYW